jgi:hypothetical protein
MMALLARARFIVGALAVCSVISLSAPASAQQSRAVDPDASVVNEQTLLRQSPRIDGRIDIPNETASVLEQPAGRTWDHFHQVTLHWLGAIIIVGTVAGLAAGYFVLGRLRISAGRSGRKVPRFKAFERFAHLADGGLVRRSRDFRAEHHLRKAAAVPVDRTGCLQRVLASCQVCARFHELSVRARPRADRRDLYQGQHP